MEPGQPATGQTTTSNSTPQGPPDKSQRLPRWAPPGSWIPAGNACPGASMGLRKKIVCLPSTPDRKPWTQEAGSDTPRIIPVPSLANPWPGGSENMPGGMPPGNIESGSSYTPPPPIYEPMAPPSMGAAATGDHDRGPPQREGSGSTSESFSGHGSGSGAPARARPGPVIQSVSGTGPESPGRADPELSSSGSDPGTVSGGSGPGVRTGDSDPRGSFPGPSIGPVVLVGASGGLLSNPQTSPCNAF
jgi:hypothetical protein